MRVRKLLAGDELDVPAPVPGAVGTATAFQDGNLSQLAFVHGDPARFNACMVAWAGGAGARGREAELSLCVQTFVRSWAVPGEAGEPLPAADQVSDTRALGSVATFAEEAQVMALLFLADALRERQPAVAQRLLRLALGERFAPCLSHKLPGPAPAMTRLFSLALEEGVEVERVKALIRQHWPPPPPDAAESLNWPWPVRIHTLGRFAVLCDNAPLAFSGKSPRKALELLQALIANGGREVSLPLLIRNLWPDEDGGDMKNLFDNTLHRLRKLMGPVEVIQVRNGKLTLDPSTCWVDAWAFQRLSGAFLAADAPTDAARGRALQRDALAALRLYSGHFLQSEGDEPWVLAYRDRIKSRYLRLVRALGGRFEQLGQWDLAIEIYERALEVDNLTEALYRQLMLCHQQLGEHAEVLRVHRRCRELLSIVLGLAPSERTESVREASVRASRRLTAPGAVPFFESSPGDLGDC